MDVCRQLRRGRSHRFHCSLWRIPIGDGDACVRGNNESDGSFYAKMLAPPMPRWHAPRRGPNFVPLTGMGVFHWKQYIYISLEFRDIATPIWLTRNYRPSMALLYWEADDYVRHCRPQFYGTEWNLFRRVFRREHLFVKYSPPYQPTQIRLWERWYLCPIAFIAPVDMRTAPTTRSLATLANARVCTMCSLWRESWWSAAPHEVSSLRTSSGCMNIFYTFSKNIYIFNYSSMWSSLPFRLAASNLPPPILLPYRFHSSSQHESMRADVTNEFTSGAVTRESSGRWYYCRVISSGQ